MSEDEIVDPQEKFENFFKSYKDEKGRFIYRKKIQQMSIEDQTSLEIDFDDLLRFDSDLAKELLETPDEILEHANNALMSIIEVEDREYYDNLKLYGSKVFARFRNLPSISHIPLRKIRSEHIGLLVTVDGILTRSSEVQPRIVEAVFECLRCRHKNYVKQETSKLQKPIVCENATCRRGGPFKLIAEESKFEDWQKIRIQEKPEELPPGQLPRAIDAVLTHDLVDQARPGDRVKIIGILRSTPQYAGRTRLSVFKTYLEVNNIEVSEKELEKTEITEEEEEKILELSRDPSIHQKIINSIAPSIYGYHDIKEAIALQLFGGVSKTLPDGMKIRGESNILLVGDPGVAKSQMLQYAAQIAPRGLYTSGKGSSAAGLTAAVLRDESGSMTLEAGALVLADRGLAAIDEFDKMNPQDRVAIHEAMEQRSYHPSTEILLSNGERIEIGEFVDNLFKKHRKEIIKGVNCEILPVSKLNYEVYTTDFKKIFKKKISKVSRHKAPEFFVSIRFSNGRQILVTPDHPIYICNDGEIVTIDAVKCKKKIFVPGPDILKFVKNENRTLPIKCEHRKVLSSIFINGEKRIKHKGIIGGYGYYYNSTINSNLRNANQQNEIKQKSIPKRVLGLETVTYTKRGAALGRINTKRIINCLPQKLIELVKREEYRRIPKKIFQSEETIRIEFLKNAFRKLGAIENTAISYTTVSKKLAYDYQDLLLTLGIHSRISRIRYTVKNGVKIKYIYKLYITGDSIPKFYNMIYPELNANEKAMQIINKSIKSKNHHDVAPTSISKRIIKSMKKLGLRYNGYFHEHLQKDLGVTKTKVKEYLTLLEKRIKTVKNKLNLCKKFRDVREAIGYSQKNTAEILGTTRSKIDYIERGGYTPKVRKMYTLRLVKRINDELKKVEYEINKIRNILNFRWLRITDVKIVKNTDVIKTEWVYDITIEPTANFISNGLILHNTISIAKAGIVATLNARTSILAAANPALGRYNEFRTPTENIKLPVTLLSRFDLIFIMTDKPDKEKDDAISDHILSLHRRESIEPPIDTELLKKYIAYAKRNCAPTLSEEAAEKIKEFYLEMRAAGEGEDAAVPITARQLEALVRLVEARAKMALKAEADVEDAEAVIRLMKASLKKVGVDKETGKFDIDILMTGAPKSQRDKIQALYDIISSLEKEQGGSAPIEEIIKRGVEEYQLTEEFIHGTIRKLLDEGSLYEPEPGYYRKP